MVPTNKRLKISKDQFERFKQGDKISNRWFTLFAITSSEEKTKFGTIISKKIASKATKRNLLRRRLQSILLEMNDLHNFDLLILPKKPILELQFQELKNKIKIAVKKLQKNEK